MVDFFRQRGAAVLGSDRRDLNADAIGQPFQSIADVYDLYESYYKNEAYERSAFLLRPKGFRADALPKSIRPIHNPTKRTVDYWPGHVYPGVWTDDGLPAGGLFG